MTVWVVHNIRELDISKAASYGGIRYINSRYVYADEIVEEAMPAQVLSRLERAAEEFDPDADYMLIAGDHLQIAALAALLASRWEEFKVLRFDREAGGYFPVRINTGH